MRLLLTGGTGFIGAALCERLRAEGHDLTVLSRSDHRDRDGQRFLRDLSQLPSSTPIDGIVNLAGASLAGRRWSDGYKREIVDSRLETTGALVSLCERLETPPAVFVSASAVGYYGPRGDEILDETSDPGAGFSADLCQRWEAAARGVEALGTRTCLARFGVVFDRGDGAFEELYRPFRFGIANWLGDGKQWLSWVHRADVVAVLALMLTDDELTGAFNVTAPEPLTNRALCRAIAARKTTLPAMPVPAPVMRLLVGEMADELLLSGQRVVPARLERAGFSYRYPNIETCLEALLGNR